MSWRAATVLLAGAAALTGCASSSSGSAPGAAHSNLREVVVTGALGSKPTLTPPTPFSVIKTQARTLTPGRGAIVNSGQRVSVDYIGVNGTSGQAFDSSYGTAPTRSFVLNESGVISGFVKGLVGATIGSRVLIAVPPADGYGVQGQPAAQIGPTDTLLFVVDIHSANVVLHRATGTPVPPKAGLPTVKLNPDGSPLITVPAGPAPKTLVTQALILGKGTKLTKGQSVTLQYTGVVWPGGRVFASTWTHGAAETYPLGMGQLLRGLDEGLAGWPVGSQVLVLIPPDKGDGAEGNAAKGIKGTDTMVFVVDILDAS
jgi:peptidylprolyl isomerase